jgi:hypothetical protein
MHGGVYDASRPIKDRIPHLAMLQTFFVNLEIPSVYINTTLPFPVCFTIMTTQTTVLRRPRQFTLSSKMDLPADKEERKREVCPRDSLWPVGLRG